MMNKFLLSFLSLIRWFLDVVSDYIYGFIYEDHRRIRIPPVRDSILLIPATELARKIRNKEVTSEAVVEAYINRIKDVNGVVNAVVDNRFADALEDARSADKLISSTSDLSGLELSKPFLGVPFTTKDCFAVTGLSWTTGLLRRKGKKAQSDAETVKRMRAAGAIPIGVTNVSELCMWMESSNNIYGRSNNPYHTGRIVGGSSGGEACIIASAGSVFGIGSDVGGSIRMPSFFCGIFGHKASSGAVINTGQLPVAGSIVDTFLSTGPMCRYATDLLPMLRVLTGEKKWKELSLDKPVDVKKLKVYYMLDDGGNPLCSKVHSDLTSAMQSLIRKLEQSLHIECVPVNIKELFYSFLIWSNKMASDPSARSFTKEMVEGEGDLNPFLEFGKWLCFKSTDHTLPAIMLGAMEKFVDTSKPGFKKALEKCEDLKKELNTLLGDDGVLLYPSHSTPAPYHGQPLLRPFNFSYTGIFNVCGNPVTQVPLGLSKSMGVPVGCQLVGARGQDRNTIALALEVEKLFGGWVKPSED